MGLRLPREAREESLTRDGTTLAQQHGRVMKEYVVVPEDLLERTGELAAWFDRSHEWIGTLKPKPTKRR